MNADLLIISLLDAGYSIEFRDVTCDAKKPDVRMYRCKNGVNGLSFRRDVDKAVDVLFCRIQSQVTPDMRCHSIAEVLQLMKQGADDVATGR